MHSCQRWSIHGLPYHADQPKKEKEIQTWAQTGTIEQINNSEINKYPHPEFQHVQYEQNQLYIVCDTN